LTETGKAGATVNLYELAGTNLGQLSPTQVMWAADYSTAVSALREPGQIEKRVVRLGPPERPAEFVSASRSRLVALRDGYQLTASASGSAMVVLPVQFSHCWQIEEGKNTDFPRIFRANIVQTGILFKDSIDIRLRFVFEPWKTSCRLQDAGDLAQFGFK
jgi:hypothetical protein